METYKKIISLFTVLALTLLVGCNGPESDEGMGGDAFIVNQKAPKGQCIGSTIAPAVLVERTTGKPVTKEVTFSKGDFDICIFIEVVGEKAPGSAVVFIDDVAVAQTSDFNANFQSLIRRISNEEIGAGEHTLRVKLVGKPTSALRIHITSDDRLSQEDGDAIGKEAIYAYSLRERLLREEERPLEFQLSPKEWLTPEQLYNLIQEAPEGTEVTVLHLMVHDGEGGGCNIPLDVEDSESLLNLRTLLEMHRSGPNCTESVQRALEDDINSGKVLIGSFRAFGTPRNMYRFWEANPESIRFIQTMASSFERAQWSYSPDDEV